MHVDRRRLRALRESRGLLQKEVADAASISKSYLCMLEAGQRSTMSPAVAARLAGVLGVAIVDICRTGPRLRPDSTRPRPRSGS